jgi:hypothetical protein
MQWHKTRTLVTGGASFIGVASGRCTRRTSGGRAGGRQLEQRHARQHPASHRSGTRRVLPGRSSTSPRRWSARPSSARHDQYCGLKTRCSSDDNRRRYLHVICEKVGGFLQVPGFFERRASPVADLGVSAADSCRSRSRRRARARAGLGRVRVGGDASIRHGSADACRAGKRRGQSPSDCLQLSHTIAAARLDVAAEGLRQRIANRRSPRSRQSPGACVGPVERHATE